MVMEAYPISDVNLIDNFKANLNDKEIDIVIRPLPIRKKIGNSIAVRNKTKYIKDMPSR